jgi:alkylated DNA repair dioxygenase AlkB
LTRERKSYLLDKSKFTFGVAKAAPSYFQGSMAHRGLSQTSAPDGFVYQREFVTPAEEAELIDFIRALPLKEAQYLQYTARRRIVSFGGSYDFSSQELRPAGPVPGFLRPLRSRIARLMGVPAAALNHALVAEYQPGTPLGWHRDVPAFGVVGGLSLLGFARMRFRPYPHRKGDRSALRIDLEPRSAYAMRAAARWNWQHAISPTRELRYSITFRTLASAINR